jgi:hypothetical protein
VKLRFLLPTVLLAAPCALSVVAHAQDEAPVAPATGLIGALPEALSSADATPAQRSAAALVAESFTVAQNTDAQSAEGKRARLAAARGAATLLPRLAGPARDVLTPRWVRLAQSSAVPRAQRSSAYDAFFESAARLDSAYARRTALMLPDAAARAGAFIDLSEAGEKTNWLQSRADATLAQQAARSETDLTSRARALTFVAYRMAVLDPSAREAAVREASSQVRLIQTPQVRDYLLAEVVGAASKFDLPLARKIAADISDENLKNLAVARTNISEISQTTLTVSTQDRVAALAKAAARYDVRAIPVLIQLPPQPDVLKALSDALPAIYPSARPAIDATLLERIWNYTKTVDASVQRDELQSRLARLMVLHDLWRGRDWGKQLAWKGGRIQVGAFLKEVVAARRSTVRAESLQDTANDNVNRAILQARTLSPAARVESLLLIAGQLLG